MATRPAMAPVAMPSTLNLPRWTYSQMPHMKAPTQAATWVASKAPTARELASKAEPALKPNQPAHNSPAPMMVTSRLCGTMGSVPKPLRGPTTLAATRPLAPAAMCTTVPPAKSMCPMLASQPVGCQIQCATGA